MRAQAGAEVLTVQRFAPRDSLAGLVDYHWVVRWRVRGTHRQQVVPQPRVDMAAEEGRLLVHGVRRGAFERLLTGEGVVLGTAFLPAGFRPLLGRSVAGLSGQVRTVAEVLGHDDRPVAAHVRTGVADADLVAVVEDFLERLGPVTDPTAPLVNDLVAQVARRHDLTRADQLATLAGLSLRSLQRLFTDYVGIGPKWVIQRCRILDAAAAANDQAPVDWAGLAHDLGFSDQAHLTRAFKQVVGTPPATYRRACGT